ncbi:MULTISPECIES: ketoacyl-ACP synthase III family protein [unclassified Streptomyces]|uniref:ketoacyl-ACP synthase III family protein n=1 Tax=unclassified Streptomyces TaxID=2593676 RepID=UPI0004BE1B65|nr:MULTISPECIES: ketoacyl-ACP synthase III family protein [unclassified Streptomyces]
MRTGNVYIAGVGVHLPAAVGATTAVDEGAYSAEEIERYGLTAVTVAGDVPAPEMALSAARQALARSGLPPADIDTLLYVSVWHQGPEGWCPQSYLQRHLLGGDCLAAEIRQGCNGVFGALELASARLESGAPGRGALIAAADNFGTPGVDRWRANPGFLLGDGGSALVLSNRDGFARLLSVGTRTVPELEELHRSGAPMFPPGATTGEQLDFGTRAARFFRSGDMPPDGGLRLLKAQEELVGACLEEAGLRTSDITRVAYMNTERAMTEERLLAPLGLTLEQSTWEFGRAVGHVSASDQVISFDHLLTTGGLRAGDRLLALGVGPGVGIGCAVIEVRETPRWVG